MASLQQRFDQASELDQQGRTDEARDAYLAVLERDPSHLLALNNLGTLLHAARYRTAARTAYAEAVARYPDDPMSLVNLANVLYESGELPEAQAHFEAALRSEPNHRDAHRGIALVLTELGDEARAETHRRQAYENAPAVALPYRGTEPPIPILLLISSLGGNIPTTNLLDDRVFQTYAIEPEFYNPQEPLPNHQLIFNAIGDADLSPSTLAAAQALIDRSGAPVINQPAAILATGRDSHARLQHIPGLILPRTMTVPRDAIPKTAQEQFRFPLLLRSPGHHSGRHFLRVESAHDLPEATAQLPGKHLTLIEYLDARGADGKSRKYRAMTIDGQLYPLHLAISGHWKIHYFSAEMADSATHRADDEAFLNDMPAALGPRAMAALTQIQEILALDYGGIDFGLSPAGDVLLFEANATTVVNPPEPDARWAYRKPAVERIFAAVRTILSSRLTV